MPSLRLKIAKLRLRVIAYLCQDSLIHRLLHIDDRVKELQESPAGMFFYNQRAIFFAGSGAFLVAITALTPIFGAGKGEYRTAITLWTFWWIGVGYTLVLHPIFRRRLARWAESAVTDKLPSLFGLYFLVDFCAVFLMILCGRSQGINLDPFALLLVANTIVYSAYVGGGRGFSLLVPGILYLLLILTFLFLPVPPATIMKQPPVWFNTLMYLGPLVSMLLVSVISVTLISWIRGSEYQTTQRQLELLGNYEGLLAGADSQRRLGKDLERTGEFSEVQFRHHVRSLFEDLCSHKMFFWYDSACMWLVRKHKDRGALLVPGPSFNFDEAQDLKQGIDASQGFLSTKDLVITNSMKYRPGKLGEFAPRFRANVDAPAAFVPLKRHGRRIGVLALYGGEAGPPPQRQDRAFLRSLGSIVSNTMEQWEGRFKAFPQREMNDLFKCRSLDEVFEQIVVILQKYLLASACEVIFRPDEKGKEMKVVAALGFLENRLDIEYVAGRGNTGICAQKGITIRVDDVSRHRDDGFDPDYLDSLERAHNKQISSWMAIPIGKKGQNHGVIKVVNRMSPWGWFTDEDQELGEDLAFRLQVIIEKFQYIEQTEVAKNEAEQQAMKAKFNAAEASAEQKRAETFARQRQIDLMTMTHQLQGPLLPVVGALSGLQQLSLPRVVHEELEFAKALAESCLTLCWGTSATFAKAAGQKISFPPDKIDAPAEMRKLGRMLQLTNTDNDLDFKYREDPDFPKLSINKGVLTSVLFSLIHNAMKYADKQSTVFLECTFERDTAEAALKVKSVGVPIYPQETDDIFKQFERGQALKKTSLKYDGRGLGLWVARELMLSVGGDLTVELSREHPRLSVFMVHIPGGLRHITGATSGA